MVYDCMTIDPRGRIQEAERLLNEVRIYDAQIDTKQADIDKLKERRLKITSTIKQDVVSASGCQDSIGRLTAQILDMENELNDEIDAFFEKKRYVCRLIDQLQDSDYIKILRYRYILYESWEQVAEEIGKGERQTRRLHKKALAAFAERMIR